MAIDLGYWTPVYGGFLRNVRDEGRMAATWEYIREVSVKADRLGFHTTLVPELYLNDRKGTDAPSLEAWSLSAAILAATDRLRVMTAVRPGVHLPAGQLPATGQGGWFGPPRGQQPSRTVQVVHEGGTHDLA